MVFRSSDLTHSAILLSFRQEGTSEFTTLFHTDGALSTGAALGGTWGTVGHRGALVGVRRIREVQMLMCLSQRATLGALPATAL